ncbi:MAG: hypothetical protein R6V72_10665 [Cyclobacterium sp.]
MEKVKVKKKFEFCHADNLPEGLPAKDLRSKMRPGQKDMKRSPKVKQIG